MRIFRVSCGGGSIVYDSLDKYHAVQMARDEGAFVWAVYEITPEGEILVGMID